MPCQPSNFAPKSAPHLPVLSSPSAIVQHLQVGGSASETEEVQVDVTRLLVQSYFAIVRANLEDTVPKALMHFLVLSVQRGLQQHLIHNLYRLASRALSYCARDVAPVQHVPCADAVLTWIAHSAPQSSAALSTSNGPLDFGLGRYLAA